MKFVCIWNIFCQLPPTNQIDDGHPELGLTTWRGWLQIVCFSMQHNQTNFLASIPDCSYSCLLTWIKYIFISLLMLSNNQMYSRLASNYSFLFHFLWAGLAGLAIWFLAFITDWQRDDESDDELSGIWLVWVLQTTHNSQPAFNAFKLLQLQLSWLLLNDV